MSNPWNIPDPEYIVQTVGTSDRGGIEMPRSDYENIMCTHGDFALLEEIERCPRCKAEREYNAAVDARIAELEAALKETLAAFEELVKTSVYDDYGGDIDADKFNQIIIRARRALEKKT